VEIRVLGPIEIVGEHGPASLGALKQRQLLAALAMRQPGTCSTDLLIDALWGESPPPSAPKLLQIYVSQLRKALPPGAQVRTRGAGYALELDDGTSLDAARFVRLLEEGREAVGEGNPALAASLLRRALGLWRGEAYGELAYEEFARAEAERLQELRLVALEARIDAELAIGRHEEVLAELRTLTARHPLRERLQAQAMVALYRCGLQSEALKLYASTRARLVELGLEPGPELRELQRRVLRHDASLTITPAAAATRSILPAPPNRLLGRTRELAELHELILREDVRLLALTGAGGSGKTRLAQEAAREASADFANGAAFVPLAPLRDPDLVLSAIASTLGIEASGDLLETLATALRPRELLLVLDNAEHLRTSAPLFVELLSRAPRLTLVVTSRVVLHLSGEHVYPVEPLAEGAAVALFAERAREAEPRFSADAANERAIGLICARVDGLPLAIELAASRVRTLTPVELLARLDPRLPLLTGGPRDLPSRQQTLRTTLDWSFELLGENERRDLARLAVFASGFTTEAAELVCGTPLERLASLLDNSLVQRVQPADETRFSMLETVREHALDMLGAERAEIELRHAFYFLELAESAEAQFFGEEHPVAAGRLDAEHDNLRTALDTFHREKRSAEELRLAAALWQHWSARGHPAEARRHLTAALAKGDTRNHSARVAALHGAALLASRQGDLDASETLASEARRLAQRLGDESGEAHALNVAGIASLLRGDPAGAAPSFAKAAELFQKAGERRGYANRAAQPRRRRDGPRPPRRRGGIRTAGAGHVPRARRPERPGLDSRQPGPHSTRARCRRACRRTPA
jgi:predicted ATPase/DNA-binding SARP family transcriptional activator